MPKTQTSRITAATIQQAIQQETIGLTDEEIFTSPEFAKIVTTMGKVMTGRIEVPVIASIIWNPNGKQAHTDNNKIVINAAHEKVQEQLTRYDRYMYILGLVFHEFGHCVYTDFDLRLKYLEGILRGAIPMIPAITTSNEDGIRDMKAFMRRGNRERFIMMLLLRDFDNLVEDVFVDASTSRDNPGVHRHCLRILNKTMYGGSLSKLLERYRERLNGRITMWGLFCGALISFLKLGYVEYGDLLGVEPAIGEIKKRIGLLGRDIHQDIMDTGHIHRKQRLNDVFACNYDLIIRDMENGTLPVDTPPMDQNTPQQNDKVSDKQKEMLEQMLKNALGNRGATHDDPGRTGGGNATESGQSGQENEPDTESQEKKPSAGGAKEKTSATKGKTETDTDTESEQSNSVPGTRPGKERQPLGQIPEVQQPLRNSPSSSADDREAARAFQEMMRSMAGQRAESEIERKHREMLNESAKSSLDKFDISAGTDIFVTRNPVIDKRLVERYDEVWPSLSGVSGRIEKQLLRYLEELGEEETNRGLITGKSFDSGSLCRRDQCYFKQRTAPTERPSIAVTALVDHSISMREDAKSRGPLNLYKTKIEAVVFAALIIYDFCVKLDIPVSVVGHYADISFFTDRAKVTLDVAASFERLDSKDRYRILNTRCVAGNRDGTALQYAIHELNKRPEEYKLLFLLCDGYPSAYLPNEASEEHIRTVLREAGRSNIRVFCAALDEDIQDIQKLFGPKTGARCYEMTDLSKLSTEIIRIIKRYLVR